MNTDLLIIGGGIVGCAIAYSLSSYGSSVAVVEQSSYPGSGATKANSAMLHSGLSTKPGSLRSELVRGARDEVLQICRKLSVPVIEQAGLLTVAFNDEEHQKLKDMVKDANYMGLHGKILERAHTLELEPHLNPKLHSAFLSNDLSVVSPYELAIAMAEYSAHHGVQWHFGHRVTSIKMCDDKLAVGFTNGKTIVVKTVINAAGMNADKVTNMLEPAGFVQHARHGEYFLYDKNIPIKINHVISVMGNAHSKGMVLVPTPHGNILAGSSSDAWPTAFDTDTTGEVLDRIYEQAVAKLCPTLPRYGKVITSFAGNRAVSDTNDFVIKRARCYEHFIIVGGIQSPGLTSCINIANYLFDNFESSFAHLKYNSSGRIPPENHPIITHMDKDSANKMIKQNSSYGEIVCRCEGVTKGDVIAAIHGVIPCRTVDSLKRKLRVGMGRCQGGFCLQRILMILSEELSIKPWEVLKDMPGSAYLADPGKDAQ